MARPGGTEEDDGWLLVLVNNAETQRTDLCILETANISAGKSLADEQYVLLHWKRQVGRLSPFAVPTNCWPRGNFGLPRVQGRCVRYIYRITSLLGEIQSFLL